MSFPAGARIELMYKPGILLPVGLGETMGFAHFAISLGSNDKVDQLTEQLRKEGVRVIGEPRTTGDGYYESVIADPEGNLIELTV